jgi:hypothetical protein
MLEMDKNNQSSNLSKNFNRHVLVVHHSTTNNTKESAKDRDFSHPVDCYVIANIGKIALDI